MKPPITKIVKIKGIYKDKMDISMNADGSGGTFKSPLKKKDACYHKVKARYDVWPSAYASGALAKCRKVGAANWGNKSKKKK